MKIFEKYLASIENPSHRQRMEEILHWVKSRFPTLKPELKWNQPMFTDHGTFIIGFSMSKKHVAVAPEKVAIAHVEDDIVRAGCDYTENVIRIPWEQPVPYSLLEKIIEFNIRDKADCTTFWRKGGNK